MNHDTRRRRRAACSLLGPVILLASPALALADAGTNRFGFTAEILVDNLISPRHADFNDGLHDCGRQQRAFGCLLINRTGQWRDERPP
jgi:hypothetical protein